MKSVEITDNGDGTYSVETESEMPETSGDPMVGGEAEAEAPEGTGQTFQSLDEALAAASAFLGGSDAGQEADAPMMEGEAEFVGGFKKSRGIEQGF